MHKIIPRSEIITHNTQEDCWIILHNMVYDITPFIKQHPGGVDILLTRAGEDATSFFQTKHGNNKRINKQLENYLIGELPEIEKIEESAFQEPFLDELIKICNQKNLFTVRPKNLFLYNLMRVCSLIIYFSILTVVLFFKIHPGLAIPLIVINAFIGTSLFGFIAHENTHRNFPKNKFLKTVLNIIWPILWPFISQKPLRYEHNSHHVKIGDIDYDFEVAGFSKFIRYSGKVPFDKMHKIQHKMSRYLYPFYANIITTWGGIKSNFWQTHNRKVALYHNISILWTFTVYAIIPFILHGSLWYFFVIYLIYQCVLFYGIYIGAAINHFIPDISNSFDSKMMKKYGYYVCANTSNFSAKSKFWFWFTGGFNIQIEHHLSPFVPVENLKQLIPIVKDLCLKYNYPYIEFDTFGQLWDAHYEYLEKMSGEDNYDFISNEVRNKSLYKAR